MNTFDAPIRWGIIGCGDVTEKKSGPAFKQIEGSALKVVMRRDGEKAQDYAKRHHVLRWTSDAQALIDDPEVDAVYIATPPGSHCEYALQVAAAGKPCYVEKPMARNATECRRMIEAFDRACSPLFVAYYRRGLGRFIEAKQIVESGDLGRLTSIRYHFAAPYHQRRELPWRVDAEIAGGGYFLDMASHALDILDFILGPLENATGQAWNRTASYPVEDVVQGSFLVGEGVPGVGTWNFASDQAADLIEIEGVAGKLSLSVFGNEPLRLARGDEIVEISRPNPETIQQPLIQTIVDELLGRGACPSTGRTALRTSEVMDSMLQSYYGDRSAEFWKTPDRWPGRPRH